MLARLYDALHDPASENQAALTCPTDTGSRRYAHRYFARRRAPVQ